MAQILGIQVKRYNMYRSGKVIDFPTDLEQSLVRGSFIINKSVLDKTYTVNSGDTLWGIAYAQYRGSRPYPSRYWWVIAIFNDIFDPTDIEYLVGKDIIIIEINSVI